MRSSATLAILAAACVDAFPAAANLGSRAQLTGEPNSGFFPNTGFDPKDQLVDVSEATGHQWIAPKSTDIRGPCPGLNAAANHGYISRTGVLDLQDTTAGLMQALGLGEDFGAPLFVFATFNSGDLVQMKWSIGGPMQKSLGGVLGQGLGISNSHARYEGDASPGRGDAFLHDGDAHSLQISNFQDLYNKANADGEFTMDTLRAHNVEAYHFSLMNNPYFFSGPVFFVPPIAHQFVVAMMSNHSAERPQGFLTKDVLKSFFSVTEADDGTLTWVPGYERIPENWYRRPSANPYGIVASFGDFGLLLADQPQFLKFGGNTGTPNSFTGVDPSDLSGGVFNTQNLLQGNNLACFAMQVALVGMPEAAQKIGALAEPFLALANSTMGPVYSKLACPQLAQYSESAFNSFPGYANKPTEQPATPY